MKMRLVVHLAPHHNTYIQIYETGILGFYFINSSNLFCFYIVKHLFLKIKVNIIFLILKFVYLSNSNLSMANPTREIYLTIG